MLQLLYACFIAPFSAAKELPSNSESLVKLIENASEAAKTLAFGTDQAAVVKVVQEAESGTFSTDNGRRNLDADLKTKTYMLNNAFTMADVAVFASVHDFMVSSILCFPKLLTSLPTNSSHAELLALPNLTRHFDLVQHENAVAAALASENLLQPALVQIDLDNVPKVERKPEPKKEKKPAAAPKEAAAAPVDGKKPKKEKGLPAQAEKPAQADKPMPHMIEMKVGKIIDVKRHPDADSLYVEQIDLGEAEPRTVVSGLVNYIPIEQMQGRLLVAICNLKPAAMRGIKSYAMVLAASSKDGKSGGVELVQVPEGSQPGDRVYFEGMEDGQPVEQLNPKKKIFESIQPNFTTLDTREAAWIDPADQKVYRIRTSKGVCQAPTFVGASLS